MALHLSVLLIFTGLTGIHSITTVSKVSVKAGGSISIPCLYEPKYTHHVKYLCKGYNWNFCSYKVKTDQPDSSGKFSISDDKQQRIFTVTINNLMMDDTDYWCAVEIKNGPDYGTYFQIVTTGWPQLSVDHQEITGFNGEDVTIHGNYSNTGEIEWCGLGGSCVKEPSGSIDGTRVTINANVPKAFTVTMSGLRTESSGWYFCTKGGLQMPVHVTVKERPSTTEPVNHTAVSAYGEPITVQGGNHRAFIIPLSLLIFIVMVASFIWFMLRRHKQTKAPASAATVAEEEVSYCAVVFKRKTLVKVEEEVSYSAVEFKRKALVKVEEEVSYSAVEFKRKALVKVEAADEDVTYSTLALQ